MDWQETIAILIAVACGLWVIKQVIQPFAGRSGCGHGTSPEDQKPLTIADPDP